MVLWIRGSHGSAKREELAMRAPIGWAYVVVLAVLLAAAQVVSAAEDEYQPETRTYCMTKQGPKPCPAI